MQGMGLGIFGQRHEREELPAEAWDGQRPTATEDGSPTRSSRVKSDPGIRGGIQKRIPAQAQCSNAQRRLNGLRELLLERHVLLAQSGGLLAHSAELWDSGGASNEKTLTSRWNSTCA